MKIVTLIICFSLVSCNTPSSLCHRDIICNPKTTDCDAEYEKAQRDCGKGWYE